MDTKQALFEFLLRLGDDRLVAAQRLSEWCGHAPILEEDIALANIALDCLGQTSALLKLAGSVEGKGRDEDALAYLRNEREFRNATMVELPNGDFGFTVLRHFLFSTFSCCVCEELSKSSNQDLAGISAKALKESKYHARHCGEWVVRLGDGTAESHERMHAALLHVWPFTNDLFFTDAVEATLTEARVIPDLSGIRAKWSALIGEVLTEATLKIPEVTFPIGLNGRLGRHTEYLGHLLSEMQILPRSHPGARW